MSTSSDKIRNIAVTGHGSTGKTTLFEQMLFLGGQIPKPETVESGKTISDFTEEESNRKISIHTALAHIPWKDRKINLLDTPGSGDFVGEVIDALRVSESAVVLVAADAGVHVIGNVDPTTATAKTARLKRKAQRAAAGPAEAALDRLAEICCGHDGGGDPLQDACVHAGGYGTRSSALLWLAEAESESILRFADGPPCTREYRDFTPLLRELGLRSRLAEGESAMRKVS